MCSYICTCINIHTYCIYIHIYTYIHICIYVSIHICICLYTYLYIWVYSYMCIYTNTHIYVYLYMCVCLDAVHIARVCRVQNNDCVGMWCAWETYPLQHVSESEERAGERARRRTCWGVYRPAICTSQRVFVWRETTGVCVWERETTGVCVCERETNLAAATDKTGRTCEVHASREAMLISLI